MRAIKQLGSSSPLTPYDNMNKLQVHNRAGCYHAPFPFWNSWRSKKKVFMRYKQILQVMIKLEHTKKLPFSHQENKFFWMHITGFLTPIGMKKMHLIYFKIFLFSAFFSCVCSNLNRVCKLCTWHYLTLLLNIQNCLQFHNRINAQCELVKRPVSITIFICK